MNAKQISEKELMDRALLFRRSAFDALRKAYDRADISFDIVSIELRGPAIACPAYEHYRALELRAQIERRLLTETDKKQIAKLNKTLRETTKTIINTAETLSK